MVDWPKLRTCFEGNDGITLLKENGEMTKKLEPPISFTSTVVVNKVTSFEFSKNKRK